MAKARTDRHDCSAPMPDSKWMSAFRRQLRNWYARHARDLPWRRTRDAYHVWLSEVMLQQTQVATVIPYFERFIKAFPKISDLAAADEDHVLRLWEGLGYYRRARQLHKAAKQIMEQHDGQFPSDPSLVDDLPGIGRYTRGAILSIAFDDRQPILEANTIRLHSRLLALEEDPHATAGQRMLWSFAEAVLPRKDVGLFNQALMELGGAICTPQAPRCLICPVASLCPTRARGLQASIPMPKRRMQYEEINETAVVMVKRGRVLIRRCEEGERWAGLWDFPRFRSLDMNANKTKVKKHATDEVKRITGLDVQLDGELATIKHGVTRYRITLSCLRTKFVQGRLRRDAGFVWVKLTELDQFPLSVTGRKIANLL